MIWVNADREDREKETLLRDNTGEPPKRGRRVEENDQETKKTFLHTCLIRAGGLAADR